VPSSHPSLGLSVFFLFFTVPCQEQESPTCPPDRSSKILLVQVWTLPSSHPSFGVSVFFLSFFSLQHTHIPKGELLTGFAMRSEPKGFSDFPVYVALT